jgi:SAM-dependent methyltransferase
MNAAVASTQSSITSTYAFEHAGMNLAHGYLLPAVTEILKNVAWGNEPKRIFELGCGSGAIAAQLTQRGYDITGVDPSVEGIAHARKAYPNLKLSEGSAYDDLASTYGQFPVLLSLEVVEHVYFPRNPITAISRISRSQLRGRWTNTSRCCGNTATSSSGPSRRFVSCWWRQVFAMCSSSESAGSALSQNR